MLLWEVAFSFSEIFFEDSVHSPISSWVIYKCTCPQHAKYSVFYQNRHFPCAPPSPFTWSCPEKLFFLSSDEKSPKMETFCWCGKGEVKNSRSTKSHQNQQVQNWFEQWKKCLRYIASNREYFEGWMKFKHVRINTQFFIHEFRFCLGPYSCMFFCVWLLLLNLMFLRLIHIGAYISNFFLFHCRVAFHCMNRSQFISFCLFLEGC